MPVSLMNPYTAQKPQTAEDMRRNMDDAKSKWQATKQADTYNLKQGGQTNNTINTKTTNPAAKVEISDNAKQAANPGGKAAQAEKTVNPYEKAHTAQEIRNVTDQQMSKAKTATGDKQRNLRAVV